MSSDEESISSDEESSEEEDATAVKNAEAARAKAENINAKKAEVRKRLEEQSAKKAKKGFMTPERKKKLRLLLRKKAAEELKKEQERKSAERRKIIDQRCGQPKNLDGANDGDLRKILEDYQERVAKIEDQKYDCEMAVMRKDFEINELNIQVNDLRGKFIKPTLKKVSKYENKFAKLQKKAAEFNFRNQLKTVKKKEFELEDESKKEGKPDWAAVVPGTKKEGEEDAVGEGEAGEAEGEPRQEIVEETPLPEPTTAEEPPPPAEEEVQPSQEEPPVEEAPQGEEAQVPAEEPSEIPPPEGEAPPIEA